MTDPTAVRSGAFEPSRSDPSPAFRTVVAAVRNAFVEEPSRPDAEPDWDLVRSIARRHQVVPLVYEGLSTGDVPAGVADRLREDVRRNTRRNLRLAGELVDVLEAFDAEGVRAMAYKGPVLASLGYGDLNRRMFLDLDVLVHPEDVLEAGRVLRTNGYVPGEAFELLGRFGRGSPLLADVAECSFYHADSGDEVELRWTHGHWANPLPASVADWWQRRETTTLAGREVAVLSPEDRLLVLATHGNKHAWRRLAWSADVAACLDVHEDLDWEAVERRARSWGVCAALHVATILGVSLSGDLATTLPDDVRSRVGADWIARTLAGRAGGRLAADPLGAPNRPEEIAFDVLATSSGRRLVGPARNLLTASVRKLLAP